MRLPPPKATPSTSIPWPSPAQGRCWHCAQDFATPRLFYATKRLARGSYLVKGNFCAWGCARAFLAERKEYRAADLTVLMMREAFGTCVRVPTRAHPGVPRPLIPANGRS